MKLLQASDVIMDCCTDLYDLIRKDGYKIVWGKDGYESVKNHDKIIMLNKPNRAGHCGFTVDSLGDEHFNVPYLTQTCLNHLKKNAPEKFFMMIEGGNIDWIAHAKDPGVVKSVLDFDSGIKIVLLDTAGELNLLDLDDDLLLLGLLLSLVTLEAELTVIDSSANGGSCGRCDKNKIDTVALCIFSCDLQGLGKKVNSNRVAIGTRGKR